MTLTDTQLVAADDDRAGIAPFSVRLPPNWFQIELADGGAPPAEGSPAVRAFAETVRAGAVRGGVVLAAGMAEALDDDQLLLATLTATVTTGPAGEDRDLDAIASAIAPFERPGGDWRRVEVMEVPAGRCVRVTGVETAGPEGVSAVIMHSLVPMPGAGAAVLDLTLVSPSAGLADGLLDLFDAISGTLTWGTGSPSPS